MTDGEWKNLCGAIGRGELSEDRRFATLAARKQNEEELNQMVEAWTVQFTPEEVTDRMQAAQIPCGIVQNAKDVFSDEQLGQRNYFLDIGPYRDGTVRPYGATFWFI